MEYINVKQASEKWGLSERRITALCRSGRIIGAQKSGNQWLIPDSAPKPLDARTKEYSEKMRPIHAYVVPYPTAIYRRWRTYESS